MRLPHSELAKTNILASQSGFTLIEIIAVLVILSILAVVAVPKYFDLQSEAQAKAMEGAMAEAIGRVNSHFAKELLGGTSYDAVDYSTADDSLGEDLGDFTLSVGAGASTTTGIPLLVTGKANTAVAAVTYGRTIPWPGTP